MPSSKGPSQLRDRMQVSRIANRFFTDWATREALLLLLSHSSRVRLCETPLMAAHQAPPSLGFSRQEYWSGVPLPSPEVIPTQGQMVLGKNINNSQTLFLYIFSVGGLLLLRSVYFKTLGFQDICFSALLFYPYLKTQYLLPELGQVTYKCRGFS